MQIRGSIQFSKVSAVLLGLVTLAIILLGGGTFKVLASYGSSDQGNIEINDREYDLYKYPSVTFLDDRYEIEFLQGSKIRVIEEAYVYFPYDQHGIFLAIPYKYDIGWKTFTVDISIKSACYVEYAEVKSGVETKLVKNGSEICDQYESYTEGRDSILKVGDPDVEIDGVYKYTLEYEVKWVLLHDREGYDELYWNVVGTGSQNSRIYSSVTVLPYEGLDPKDVVCYTGVSDSTEQNCDAEVTDDGGVFVEITEPLKVGEGYTIGVRYPKDSFYEILGGRPTIWDVFVRDILPFLGCCIPIPVFIIMFAVWFFMGKDHKPYGVIPLWRPTENLTPMMAGYVERMSSKTKDLSAQIVDLAIRGFLKIEQKTRNDYVFHKAVVDWSTIENLSTYERTIMQGLFGTSGEKASVTDKDLQYQFFTSAEKARNEVQSSAVNSGYFEGNPVAKISCFSVLGVGLGSAIGFIGSSILDAPSYIAGGVVSAIIIIGFGIFMGKRSIKGTQVYRDVLGLRQYIDMAEDDRIKFHNNPDKVEEDDRNLADNRNDEATRKLKIRVFETLLPFAMVFGLENKWAKEFEDIYTEPPGWYSSHDMTAFNAGYLARSLSGFNSRMNSTTYASPRSEGSHVSFGGSSFSGGHSGGGFGGGSSGSW